VEKGRKNRENRPGGREHDENGSRFSVTGGFESDIMIMAECGPKFNA
jgi:hypothetical protein